LKVVIFDFDGTIVDSLETVICVLNQLAVEFGYPVAQPEEIEQLRNMSSREIIQRSQVAPYKLPFLLRRVRQELNREIERLEPIPEMKPTLLALKQQGHQLGIVTSNSSQNVRAFLKAQALEHVFDFVSTGLALLGKSRVLQRLLKRQQLHPANAIYVGDETRDIEAARRIGIPSVAVSWGFNSSQILATENPNFLIHQPGDLLQVVADLESQGNNL
jgi:HAD superfamily hydrolase (TIGR01509 family)